MKLAAGDWQAQIAPERGGAILSLRRRGRDILRPTPDRIDDPFDVACFPLVPYANRIGDGRFSWRGIQYVLPRNHPGQVHPLHGIGWRVPWEVTAHDDAGVTMRISHAGDADWPWPFAAEQELRLSPAGLDATLTIENTGAAPAPMSLGFHPYFALDDAEALRFSADGVWLVGDTLLPSRHASPEAVVDWSGGAPLVRPELVDHCYTGWPGSARIALDDGDIILTGEGTPALHVYLPPGQGFFCAEPVTAMPDAVNHDAVDTLPPGDRRTIAMHIRSA